MQTSSPESDQKIWAQREGDYLWLTYLSGTTHRSRLKTWNNTSVDYFLCWSLLWVKKNNNKKTGSNTFLFLKCNSFPDPSYQTLGFMLIDCRPIILLVLCGIYNLSNGKVICREWWISWLSPKCLWNCFNIMYIHLKNKMGKFQYFLRPVNWQSFNTFPHFPDLHPV